MFFIVASEPISNLNSTMLQTIQKMVATCFQFTGRCYKLWTQCHPPVV